MSTITLVQPTDFNASQFDVNPDTKKITIIGGVTASASPLHVYAIAITAKGQAVLPISPPPLDFQTVSLTVNGQVFYYPYITASSVAVTWANAAFVLEPSDDVTVSYE